jgi:hypothetical protein
MGATRSFRQIRENGEALVRDDPGGIPRRNSWVDELADELAYEKMNLIRQADGWCYELCSCLLPCIQNGHNMGRCGLPSVPLQVSQGA